jgi:hypothetical protein
MNIMKIEALSASVLQYGLSPLHECPLNQALFDFFMHHLAKHSLKIRVLKTTGGEGAPHCMVASRGLGWAP